MRIELKDDSIVIATDPKTERDLAPQILAFLLDLHPNTEEVEEVEEVEETVTPTSQRWVQGWVARPVPIDPQEFKSWLTSNSLGPVLDCLGEYCGGPVDQFSSAFALSRELPQSCRKLGLDRWTKMVDYLYSQEVYLGEPAERSIRSYYNTALRSLDQ